MASFTPESLVGKSAPNFPFDMLSLLGDGQLKSSSLAEVQKNGLPTVIDFYTTWCGSCPKTARQIEAFARQPKYAGKINFLLINVEGADTEEGVQTFAKENEIASCQMGILEEENLPLEYGVKGIPHKTLVDSSGNVVLNLDGKCDLKEDDLDSVLRNTLDKDDEALPSAHKKKPKVSSRVTREFQAWEHNEPILKENPSRWVMFPIQYPQIWEMYKKHEASFWTAEEIDLSQDNKDWESLNEGEQHFIKHVLAFFAASDGIVIENLSARFSVELQLPEARAFYGFQIMMENIHSETYSLLIEQYIRDAAEKTKLFHAIETVPAVQQKASWAAQWMESGCFAERLIAFAAVEGILFSGSFCSIYWLKKRGLMPGLTFSNELISRDEGLHAEFATILYGMLERRLPDDVVNDIIRGAVDVERSFICEALPCRLVGMNMDMMTRYIEFVADRLLTALGHPKIFNSANPFDWMELISLQGKTNFFERRVGEYQKAGVMSGDKAEEHNTFSLDVDF